MWLRKKLQKKFITEKKYHHLKNVIFFNERIKAASSKAASSEAASSKAASSEAASSEAASSDSIINNKKDVLIKCIELDPENSDYYFELKLILIGGKEYNSIDLLNKAIELNGSKGEYYIEFINLSYRMPCINLPNNLKSIKEIIECSQKLLIDAIEKNPFEYKNYYYLAQIGNYISYFNNITLNDGSVLTKNQLNIKSLECIFHNFPLVAKILSETKPEADADADAEAEADADAEAEANIEAIILEIEKFDLEYYYKIIGECDLKRNKILSIQDYNFTAKDLIINAMSLYYPCSLLIKCSDLLMPDEIIIINNVKLDRVNCLEKGIEYCLLEIHLYPNCEGNYYQLFLFLNKLNKTTIILNSGIEMSLKDLIITELKLSGFNWLYYEELILCMNSINDIFTIDGTDYTILDLYDIVIKRFPNYSKIYTCLASWLINFADYYYLQELLLKSIKLDPLNDWAYRDLALLAITNNHDIVNIDGIDYTIIDLYNVAIKLNPTRSMTFLVLVCYMNQKQLSNIQLGNTKYSRIELLLKAIDINDAPQVYFQIAESLIDMNESFIYINSVKYNISDLYIKAINLEPTAKYYYNLARFLNKSKISTIKINDAEMSITEIYREAIKLNPNCAFYYCFFALYLKKNDTDYNTRLTIIDLYKKAIYLNPKNPTYYYNLAYYLISLSENNVVEIDIFNENYKAADTSVSMTIKDLLVKCILLDSSKGLYFNTLANFLDKEETCIINDNVWIKECLKQKAYLLGYIDNNLLQNENDVFYYNIALTLKNDYIYINNKRMTKIDLYVKAIELNPTKILYYYDLACLLDNNKIITFSNKTVVNKKSLLIKVLDYYIKGNDVKGNDEQLDIVKTINSLIE